ncbi:hypothetical protein ACFQGE_09200 [Halomicroarcula sp. GCM10025817]|uniref:hypothetical protein n=1 Tax=Halomicroarcula sp. GCM10025817 TaxID=3252672 RepID=UPI00360E6AC2
MGSSLLRQVLALFHGTEEETDGTDDGPEPTTTILRTCPDCEKTFIVEDRDTCPDCDTPMDETPNERDLGFW